MDTELLVPYGQSPEGRLVSATDATHETTYCCPDCLSPLVLHAGQLVVRHFAHKSSGPCTSETIAHKTAKRLLVQVISEYSSASRTQKISIVCNCKHCKKPTSISLPLNSFSIAIEEHRIGSFVCDVMAFRGSTPVLGIEVLVTHAVDEKKGFELQTPWVELTATEVLENPYFWRPTASRLKPVACADCKNHADKLKGISERWSQPLHEPARFRDSPKNSYLAAIECCWKCKNEILVYWWDAVPFATKEPPAPKPKTIQYRHSKTFGGSYWANTCPNCNSIQGDNFLFLQENNLFRDLPLREGPETRAHRSRITSKFIDVMLKNVGG